MTADEYQFWAKQAEEARKSILPSLRDVATKWAATLTGVAAILATFGITLSPTMLADRNLMLGKVDLAQGAPLILLLTFAALVVGVVYANLAAQGVEDWRTFEPEPYRESYFKDVANTVARLRQSRTAALVAAGGGFLLSAMVVFSEPKAKEVASAPFVRATTANGMFCGTLQEGPNGQLEVKTKSGKTTKGAVITAVTPAQSCPEVPLSTGKESGEEK